MLSAIDRYLDLNKIFSLGGRNTVMAELLGMVAYQGQQKCAGFFFRHEIRECVCAPRSWTARNQCNERTKLQTMLWPAMCLLFCALADTAAVGPP